MKGYLLDTNLLIALLWPAHARHRPAVKWFARHRAKGWASCPLTEAGFVRIVSNPAFSRDAVTPRESRRSPNRDRRSARRWRRWRNPWVEAAPSSDDKGHRHWILDILRTFCGRAPHPLLFCQGKAAASRLPGLTL